MLSKKIINHNPILTLIFIFFMGLLVCTNTDKAQAKTKKFRFKKTITTLSVNKSFRYRIAGCNNKTKITFYSNHPKIASIKKKSGILKAKKKGCVTITAKIKQSKKKTVLLKTKLRITKKNTKTTSSKSTNSSLNKQASQSNTSLNTVSNSNILEDVSWSADTSINPWNHSLILYSDRILLKKEVQNSTLTLSRSGQNIGQADYYSLSNDGRKITYQLTQQTTKKLCPGNGTANGNYCISSTILNTKLVTNYEERLTPGTLCGFVSDTSHNALSNVVVSLYKSGSPSNYFAQTKTDTFGAYCFKKIPTGSYYMTYSHSNFNTKTTSTFDMPDSTYCINIVLHQPSHSVSISLIDEDNISMPNCTVTITNTRTNDSWNGKTNADGFFMLSNSSIDNITSCSLINYIDGKISYNSNSSFMPKINSDAQMIADDFFVDDSYRITIYPSDSKNKDTSATSLKLSKENTKASADFSNCYQPMSFSFTPNSFQQENILFALTPQKIPATKFSSLSISNNFESNDEIVSDFIFSIYTQSGKILSQNIITTKTSSNYVDLADNINLYLQQHKLYLPDDSYYISLVSANTASVFSCKPSLQKISVKNGIVSSIKFSLQSGTPTRLLVYGHFTTVPSSDTPIILYKKADTIWFPIYNFSSNKWTHVSDDIYKIYLDHSLYEDNAVYQIASSTPSSENTDSIFIIHSNETSHVVTHSSISDTTSLYGDIYSSVTPDFKLYFHQELSSNINTNEFIAPIPITDELINSDVDEKNCVTVCYSSTGTKCSISWTSKNDNLVFNNANTYIFDHLDMHCPIKTTQYSYH